MLITKPTKKEWVRWGMNNEFIFKPKPSKFVPPRIKPLSDVDYHLLDYLMALMAYDMKGFTSSEFTAGSLSYLLRTYGENFTLMGHNIYKYHLTEVRNA
jgi:hypothetical protein